MERKDRDVEALWAEVKRLHYVLSEAVRVCRDLDDEALAREGRLACGAECADAIEDLVAGVAPPRPRVEYEYEVWQDGVLQAGGREADHDSAQSEANHFAAMYTPEGPVEVRIYEQRLLSAHQQRAAVDGAKEADLWRCTVCGRVGTVGRCCGEETRERLSEENKA